MGIQKKQKKVVQSLLWLTLALSLFQHSLLTVFIQVGDFPGQNIGECSPRDEALLQSHRTVAGSDLGVTILFEQVPFFTPPTKPTCWNQHGSQSTVAPSLADFGVGNIVVSSSFTFVARTDARKMTESVVNTLRGKGVTGHHFYLEFNNPHYFYNYVTNPANCYKSCATCQSSLENACYSCKTDFELNWTGESDEKKRGRCLCTQGAVNAGGDGCDSVCDQSCGSCKQAGADKCYTCAFNTMAEGTRAADGTLASCTYSGACYGTCETCGGPNANQCFTCKDWTANGPALSFSSNTCSCPPGRIIHIAGSACATCDQTCGACNEPGVDKCTSCPNTADWDHIVGSTPGVGTCRRKCHETCQTCSVNKQKDKCLTCKDLGAAGTLTLLNGECRCQSGTYFVAGEARCTPCHSDCTSCVSPGKDQCTVCAGNLMIMVPRSSGGVSGSCSSIFDTKGKVKSQYSKRMDTPTISNNKNSGVTYFSIQDYKVGRRRPRRRASKALRRKIQVSLTTTTLSRIEALGSQFRYQDLCRVNYEARGKAVQEDVDFTVSTSVSATKDSLDFSFNMINTQIQSVTAGFTFINNNYFFQNIPNLTPASRILQEFGTTNQDLINNIPFIANTTFRATITTQDYDEWAADIMAFLGAILIPVIYLAITISTAWTAILTFIKPKNNLLRIAKYLEFVTALSWTVKIAFIPALYSIYELVFLDELAKVDTLLMGEVVQEREVRSALGSKNKFGEYSIPVLVVNSVTIPFGFLAVFVIAIGVAKIVYMVRSKREEAHMGSSNRNAKTEAKKNNKNSPFLDLLKISFALVLPTIYFYSLVEVTWNTREGDTNNTASIMSFVEYLIISCYYSWVGGWMGHIPHNFRKA